MLVVFRTDSSILIGAGHLMRCKALADELSRYGARVVFVCRDLTGDFTSLLHAGGLETIILGRGIFDETHETYSKEGSKENSSYFQQIEDSAQTSFAIGGMKPDWLIVDHYSLDWEWERRMRRRVGKIMVIDDMTDRFHDCDLLLNQNLSSDSTPVYAGLLPEKARQILGPQFALLRSEFHECRRNLGARVGSMKRILISFGSVDLSGESVKALEAVRMFDRENVITDVVVGLTNPCSTQLYAMSKFGSKIKFHCQADSMAKLMAQTDLSIGAGGITSWERCCLGLPAIVKPIALNQLSLTERLTEKGAIHLIPFSVQTVPEDYLAALEAMDSRRLFEMSRAGMELVDGLGCRRVAQCLLDF